MKKKNMIYIIMNSVIISSIIIFFMFKTGTSVLSLALYCAISNTMIAVNDYKSNRCNNTNKE